MEPVLYAVGDVHGRDDLLGQVHDHIRTHHDLLHPGRPGQIIHLGDYIDGGTESAGVLDRLMVGVDGFHTTCLMGNHEAMLLECLATDNRQAWYTWLSNGGEETVANLGLSLHFGGYDPAALADALGPDRVAWLRTLPLCQDAAPYFFVHAGIVPGVPLDQQQPKDMLWIRSRFLDSEADHGRIIVHGHTPGDGPVNRPNRICVDTGAIANGCVTAAVLDKDAPPLFLHAKGRAGRTP